eukprot:1042435_1
MIQRNISLIKEMIHWYYVWNMHPTLQLIIREQSIDCGQWNKALSNAILTLVGGKMHSNNHIESVYGLNVHTYSHQTNQLMTYVWQKHAEFKVDFRISVDDGCVAYFKHMIGEETRRSYRCIRSISHGFICVDSVEMNQNIQMDKDKAKIQEISYKLF